MAIQVWIVDGLEIAIEEILDFHAFDTEIDLDLTRCTTLAEFSETGFVDDDENWKAAVLRSFSGRLSGTVALIMDPDEAVAWASADPSQAGIIGCFTQLGGCVAAGLIASARRVLGGPIESGDSHFVENSLAGCLLGTHAPSDSILIGSQLRIRSGGRSLMAHLQLVLDPKATQSLLTSLSVSLH